MFRSSLPVGLVMKKYKKLAKLYEKIPEVNCKGLCSEACAFIKMSDFEQQRLDKKYGKADYLCNPCPILLIDGKCSIYKDRPFVCRMFGATKRLPCPFGCKPEEYIADKAAALLFNQLDKL